MCIQPKTVHLLGQSHCKSAEDWAYASLGVIRLVAPVGWAAWSRVTPSRGICRCLGDDPSCFRAYFCHLWFHWFWLAPEYTILRALGAFCLSLPCGHRPSIPNVWLTVWDGGCQSREIACESQQEFQGPQSPVVGTSLCGAGFVGEADASWLYCSGRSFATFLEVVCRLIDPVLVEASDFYEFVGCSFLPKRLWDGRSYFQNWAHARWSCVALPQDAAQEGKAWPQGHLQRRQRDPGPVSWLGNFTSTICTLHAEDTESRIEGQQGPPFWRFFNCLLLLHHAEAALSIHHFKVPKNSASSVFCQYRAVLQTLSLPNYANLCQSVWTMVCRSRSTRTLAIPLWPGFSYCITIASKTSEGPCWCC